MHKIENHNEGYRNGTKSYEQGLNDFSVLSTEEFFKNYTGFVPSSINATFSPHPKTRHTRQATPESWSWLDYPNIIGPAQNQGPCGSCTVFAVIGTMEAHMRIWYGINTKLSEQEAMQCCGGCGGGTNTYIYDYAKNGATSEANLKYEAKVLENCNTDRSRVKGSEVLSYYRVQRGSDAVKNAMWHLVNVGPLATGLCVPGSFAHYKSGIFDEESLNNCGWHAVMVIGFGSENGKDYWLARNSYGEFHELNLLFNKKYFEIVKGLAGA